MAEYFAPELGSRSMNAYRQRVLARAQEELKQHYGAGLATLTMAQIANDQRQLRAYPGLERCDMDRVQDHLVLVTPETVTDAELAAAERVQLGGQQLVEDAAAGEATRLGLGTKYLLTPERLVEALLSHNFRNPERLIDIPVQPNDLAPISLGVRHKLQLVYDLVAMATNPTGSPCLNPNEVVKSQVTLTVLNEETWLPIVREFARFGHLGLDPERTLFMVQEKGLGMGIQDGNLFFDPRSEFRLWNHADMKMQQTLEGKVFWVRINSQTGELERHYLRPEEVEQIFASMQNQISYPIEDIDYLTGAINLRNLALALRLGEQGFRMSQEAVAQQVPPQEGGFFTFDPQLSGGRVVCIESDAGGNVIHKGTLAMIRFLNKNFNMFPNPVEAFRVLWQLAMPSHLTVKGGFLYPQGVQGDLNLSLSTAFISRQPLMPIRNLKELKHGPATLLAMQAQDHQPGYLNLAREKGII
jgi:hypothetical protein